MEEKTEKPDLSHILTIPGKKGLYKVVSQTRNGLIVESLEDGRKMPVFTTERSSSLGDISIFSTEGEIPLKEVFWKIHEATSGQPGIDPATASREQLKSKFEEILPSYDKDRVYVSDIKKVFSWYNLLLEKGLISKPEKVEEETEEEKEESGKGKGQAESPSAGAGTSAKTGQQHKKVQPGKGKPKS